MYDDAPRNEAASTPVTATARYAVGTRVCVWNQFLEQWSGGFEVAELRPAGYRLRRVSDGHVISDVFSFDDVLVERRRNPLRGITGSQLDRRA